MTDRDKIKLLKAGIDVIKITGVPAKEIKQLYRDHNGSEASTPHWKIIKKFKTVGSTKEAFEELLKDDKTIDGAGL